ncbi:hypothetical protein QYF61_018056 [Mycteria americana]|uniref:Uncharacterized protein n=1 Tax=Mycteria americana TaxID=33587 RepID=A0AAN7N7Q0_MYCAM|nr:hypothetical protein QYF61_018056 [Mycteria americana]
MTENQLKRYRNQRWPQYQWEDGKVRNNREEIEEKEKRGRVTLQAALLAALREDQEKGRENTGVQAPKASLHSRNCMGISVSSVSRGRKRLLEAEAMKQSP